MFTSSNSFVKVKDYQFFLLVIFTSSSSFVEVKDDQIEELTREIQMYYGIKRHIEELTKENQVIL